MVRIAVFVSGGGTNLQSLIDSVKEGYINGEIALVVSNKEKAYGLERARNAGIKAEWIKDDQLLIQRLKEEKIDSLYKALKSCGFDLTAVKALVDIAYENKISNVSLGEFLCNLDDETIRKTFDKKQNGIVDFTIPFLFYRGVMLP